MKKLIIQGNQQGKTLPKRWEDKSNPVQTEVAAARIMKNKVSIFCFKKKDNSDQYNQFQQSQVQQQQQVEQQKQQQYQQQQQLEKQKQ